MRKKAATPKKPTPNNSVRTKRISVKLPATPIAKPTMRSSAKDIVNKASAKAKSNALKAANKPSTSASATAARAAAAKRAMLVPPGQRTEAQKRAIANAKTGGMKKVPKLYVGRGRMRFGGSGGGMGGSGFPLINDMNK
jgi:hypothetical protein